MNTGKLTYRFFRKHWWVSTLFILSIVGGILAIAGFMQDKMDFANSLYNTIKLFLMGYTFLEPVNPYLPWQSELARWIFFVVFLWITFQLFITIVAPRFLQYARIRRYKNHIVICGLNTIGKELIRKLNVTQIVVIDADCDCDTETLKQQNVKFVKGDPADTSVLKRANIDKASQLYAITANDTKNVEIAQLACLWSKNNSRKQPEPLKCYTLIYDRGLKKVLEETALFKYAAQEDEQFYFDGILFNINETGVQYGIGANIDKILLQKPNKAPHFLIIGLSDKAENVILDLAHCLTMNREAFRFTIIEPNEKIIVDFQSKHTYLQGFTEIKFQSDICEVCENDRFTAIFICFDNQTESIKTAISVRNQIADNQPNIFTFSEESDTLNKVLNTESYNILPMKDRNIFLINTLEETILYIVKLNSTIEKLAETAHNLWRKKDAQGHFTDKNEYVHLSGQFKQVNRNQVLDNYLRTFVATGKTLDQWEKSSSVVFSDKDRETLAMIEHRRWMLEKYKNGWRYGKIRDDNFKRHTDFCPWEELSESNRQKDYNAIDIMLNQLNQ